MSGAVPLICQKKSYLMNYKSIATLALSLVAMLAVSSAAQARDYDWNATVTGASTHNYNDGSSCKNGHITIKGSSTVNILALKCDYLRVYIEGASTLHIHAAAIPSHLSVHIEGASTVSVKGGINTVSGDMEGSSTLTVIGHVTNDKLAVSGGSTFNVN